MQSHVISMHERGVSRGYRALLLCVLILGLGVGVGCRGDQETSPANRRDVAPDDTSGGEVDGSEDGSTSDFQADRTLQLASISDSVRITFDEWGIPHIRCQRALDCFAAQGYLHADDRFFQMDLLRRQTLGELSTLVGRFGLGRDTTFRRIMTTRQGEPLEDAYFEQSSESTKAMLRAYAEGVNAWLDDQKAGENGATLTKEYDNPLVSSENIPDWTPQDTVALYLQLSFQLSETATEDLARARRMDALDAQTASDLLTLKPGISSNILEASGVTELQSGRIKAGKRSNSQVIRQLERRLDPASDVIRRAHRELTSSPPLVFGPRSGRDGSNSWALQPSRTRDNAALLANDPHLDLQNPAIWYWVELHAEESGLHVAGASIASVPGIVVGHNESIAWGVTTARLDLADAYVETLTSNGEAVQFNGQTVDLIEKTYEFDIHNGGTETRTFEWVPHHGPIIAKDTDQQRAISIKWVAQNPSNDLDFIRPLMNASNTQEALESLDPIDAINQNWLIIDKEGSIAWRPQGALPKRPWASKQTPNWLPLPGQGDAEWQGEVAPSDLPQIVDPPNGFIATANNDFDGSYDDGDPTNDGHTPWQIPPAMGHRHARIVERIESGGDQHTMQTMVDIQADTHSLHGETLVPHVIEAADRANNLSGRAQTTLEALRNWDYTCPTGLEGTDPEKAQPSGDAKTTSESIGCSAFHALMPYLTRAVFEDELEPLRSIEDVSANMHDLQAALIYVFDQPNQLAGGTNYIDDITTSGTTETEADVVAEALDRAGDKLESIFESDSSDDWRWGRIHTVTFQGPLGQGLFNNGPYANDGGYLTVDVANPSARGSFDGDFTQTRGSSMRFVARATDDGIEGQFQLPGGQDHHRESRWYGSLVEDWLNNQPRDLLFGREEVEENGVRRLRITPAE